MYDVIVVGAGPAGCMVSKKTAEHGLKVMLIEKLEVPREKSCSGILIEKSIKMVENEFGRIPRKVLSKPNINKGIIITNENGQTFKFESDGLNIWRSSFDHWLMMGASDAGAEFRPLTAAISCEERDGHVSVKLNNGVSDEKARIVVVCEGANSIIKRKLRNRQNDHIFTYQTFCNGFTDLDPNFFHAFMHPHLSQYDAWYNVKDDFLITGIAVEDRNKIKHYHEKFLSFLRTNFNAQLTLVKGEMGVLPKILPEQNIDLGIGRVLFAGESANLLNPLGEGISIALSSGYAAAEAIGSTYSDAGYNSQLLMDEYEKNMYNEKQYMTRQWQYLKKYLLNFSYK